MGNPVGLESLGMGNGPAEVSILQAVGSYPTRVVVVAWKVHYGSRKRWSVWGEGDELS